MSRILLTGDSPFLGTGLGRSLRHVGQGLTALGHEVAFAGAGDPRPVTPERVYEAELPGYVYSWADSNLAPVDHNRLAGSVQFLREAVATFQPDTVVCLGDPWQFQALPHLVPQSVPLEGRRAPRFVLWLTVDSQPFPRIYAPVLDAADQILTTTRWGAAVLGRGFGVMDAAPCGWRARPVPLGVDKTVFKPAAPTPALPAGREGGGAERGGAEGCVAREPGSPPPSTGGAQGGQERVSSRLILGWVGRNQGRKNPIHALYILREILKHKPAFLLMKTSIESATTGGTSLADWCASLGLRLTVRAPEQKPDADVYVIERELPDKGMAVIYQSADLLLHTSSAGAPELPVLEARACGTKVVAVDTSCFSEWADIVYEPAGWQIAETGARLAVPDVDGMARGIIGQVLNDWPARMFHDAPDPVLDWRQVAERLADELERGQLSEMGGVTL